MRQVLFEIPGIHLRIFGYGFMLFLSLLASMFLAARLARKNRLNPDTIYDLAMWLFVGGLIGARLFYVWQYWGTRVNRLGDILKIWEGGIVLYGSILGGTVAFLLFRRWARFPFLPMVDVVAPALALGIAIGRLGCFLNGCCYGDISDVPWAASFPGPRAGQPPSPPWVDQVHRGLLTDQAAWSWPVHPTQLYSAADGLVLTLLLLAYFPLRKRDGEVMALLVVTYPITRFLIEWLRNDEGDFWGGMTISQLISAVVLCGGFLFWFWLSRRPKVRFDQLPAQT